MLLREVINFEQAEQYILESIAIEYVESNHL